MYLRVTSHGQLPPRHTLVSSAHSMAGQDLTLCCVSAGAVLHQHIVEGLMVAVRQTVHIHVSDPLVPHHARGVPAVDHTVVAVPVGRGRWPVSSQGALEWQWHQETGWGSHTLVHYLLLPCVRSSLRHPVQLTNSLPVNRALHWKRITCCCCLIL